MPTYEYRCTDCGTEFEKFQRMSDAPGAECPSCGAASERKISAGAGLLFKGSGFYITDYRGEGYKKAAEADKGGSGAKSESGGKSESGSGGKSEGGSSSSSSSSSTKSGGGSSSGGSSSGSSSAAPKSE